MNAARMVLCLAVSAAAGVWAVVQAISAYEAERMDAWGLENYVSAPLEDIPPNSRWYFRHAQSRLDLLFPSDSETAREANGEAIRRSPLRARYWRQAAEIRVLRGAMEEARPALEVAEQLQPNNPEILLDSAQFWALLGEREKALANVNRVAALDFRGRCEAAGALLRLGVRPSDAADQLIDHSLTDEEIADLLLELFGGNRQENQTLFEDFPEEMLAIPRYRKLIAEKLRNPLLAEEAQQLWALESGGERVILPSGDMILNAGLSVVPARDFPFGWQPLQGRQNARLTWRREPGEEGVLILTLSPPEDGPEQIGWTFFRMPVGPLSEPLTARLMFQASPRDNLRGRMRAQIADMRITGPDMLGEGGLAITIPAADQPRLIEFGLELTNASNTASLTIWIEGLEFEGAESGPLP